jgi:hypothetical protein
VTDTTALIELLAVVDLALKIRRRRRLRAQRLTPVV